MFTVLAGLVLGSVDGRAALMLLIPLIGVAMATRTLDGRIKRYRAADRAAASAVSGLLGDMMAAATTVKVNNAIEPTIAHLRKLVDLRRRTAVRDRVLDESVWAFSQGAADVGLGLVLLSAAGAMASGKFSVGELAVFSAYLGWLSFLPRMVGRMLARRKQVAVAFDRMSLLVADTEVGNTVTDRDLPIGLRDQRNRPDTARPARVPLDVFDVRHLTALYPAGAGVHDVSFTVPRGSFTVLTGPIGSGKSTLLRATFGLAHQADVTGDVLWNGERLQDRAAFLIPPNAAFLPQVPQLISDSVADNIALGIVDDAQLTLALQLAAVLADIEEMPDGAANADRAARIAAVRWSTAASCHGACAGALTRTRRARRPFQRARHRDRVAAVGQSLRRRHHRARCVPPHCRLRARRSGAAARWRAARVARHFIHLRSSRLDAFFQTDVNLLRSSKRSLRSIVTNSATARRVDGISLAAVRSHSSATAVSWWSPSTDWTSATARANLRTSRP